MAEMNAALLNAQRLCFAPISEITKDGWKVVFSTDVFALYKRRSELSNAVLYLMTGTFEDVRYIGV